MNKNILKVTKKLKFKSVSKVIGKIDNIKRIILEKTNEYLLISK